jgi:hypothetical protein
VRYKWLQIVAVAGAMSLVGYAMASPVMDAGDGTYLISHGQLRLGAPPQVRKQSRINFRFRWAVQGKVGSACTLLAAWTFGSSPPSRDLRARPRLGHRPWFLPTASTLSNPARQPSPFVG